MSNAAGHLSNRTPTVPGRDAASGPAFRQRALRLAALGTGLVGALLFVWSIRAAGATGVLAGVRRVGWWFGLIGALGGLRYVVRAIAWRMCLDNPRLLPVASAFGAAVAGDALGNVTPFGVFVSEPSKVALVRPHIGVGPAISAVTIENLFYIASVVIVFIGGTGALLLSFDIGIALRRTAYLTLGGAICMAIVTVIVLMRRVRVASMLARVLGAFPFLQRAIGRRQPDIVAIEDHVFGFTSRHPRRVPRILALEAAYHVIGVIEIWLTLTLITGTPIGLLTAFVLEFVNRTITIAFQFVPMWMGVDEAGTGAVATALHLGGAAGVGLALVRKARVVVWTGLGLGLFFMSRSGARASDARPTVTMSRRSGS